MTLKLINIDGITTVVGPRGKEGPRGPVGEMGLPGVNGRDGRDAPTKEEILSALRSDEDLKNSIINNLEWDWEIERDDLGFLKRIHAKGKLKEENE